MDELVCGLSEGLHPVIVSLRPQATVEALKECIDRKYIHIKFTDTRGGTELSFPLDLDRCDITAVQSENRKGTIRVAGSLTLNYVRVRCVADITLESMSGQGRLEVLEGASANTVETESRL